MHKYIIKSNNGAATVFLTEKGIWSMDIQNAAKFEDIGPARDALKASVTNATVRSRAVIEPIC